MQAQLDNVTIVWCCWAGSSGPVSFTKPVKVSGHMKINAVSTHSSLALELSKRNLEEKLDQEPAVCQ